MKKPFQVFRRDDALLGSGEESSSGFVLDRKVDESFSDGMGAGLFRVNKTPTPAVMPHDEIAICIEGTLILTVGTEKRFLQPGDIAWIPKGTDIVFDGENAVAAYTVYPVDWRTRLETANNSQ